MALLNGPVHCSWCGRHYAYRYGFDGKNIFVLTWDLCTFFWFWWHPHFCSNSCKLAYQHSKGEIGIQRDITKIKSAILFLKGLKPQKVDNPSKSPPLTVLQEQVTIKSELDEKSRTTEAIEQVSKDAKDTAIQLPTQPVLQEQTTIKSELDEKSRTTEAIEQVSKGVQDTVIKLPIVDTASNQEDRFNFLRENDRIYKALNFKKKKGFFKRILPSSWILTIGFYGLVAFIFMMIATLVIPEENEIATMIASLIFIFVNPILLLVIGIKNRVKYIKDKKPWKECTNNGKQKIENVYAEFEKLRKDFVEK
jgi:hypothetical protein